MNNGSKTDYYNIPPNADGFVDVDRIAEHLGLTFAEGNVIKAIFGIAIERKTGKPRHEGTKTSRDRNKLVHYSKQV